MQQYNRNNFHKHTFCVFAEVEPVCPENKKPDYTSRSGSAYYFTENGVYRLSNHWGRAANCKWRLQGSGNPARGRTRMGYAAWTDFHADNDTERLYYIDVDFDRGIVTCQHKNNLKSAEKPVFRTGSETAKIIKQIRHLFTSGNWARHHDSETGQLRKRIITELVYSSKTLQKIKAELLNR